MSAPELFRAVVPVAEIATGVAFYERVLELTGDWIGAGRVYLHGRGAILVCDHDLRPSAYHVIDLILRVRGLRICAARGKHI